MGARARFFRKRSRRSRAAGFARAALVAVLSAWLLYVIGINAFLSTSLFDAAFASVREDILIHYTHAWSVWPGTIHARNLEIRGQDSNVEWRLTLERIVFDVSFRALAHQRFSVGRALGSGVTFRARRTLDMRPVSLEEVADLPPLSERTAYTVSPAGPPSLERWFAKDYHLWTVSLENVRAEDVREIWIDEGHFEGRASIVGRFYLKPIRAFDVGPTTVTIAEGKLRSGIRTPVLDQLAGTAKLTIDHNDPRDLAGADIFHFLSLTTDLRGRSADLAGVPLLATNGFSSSGIVDITALALDLDHGQVRSAHADIAAPSLGTTRKGLRLTCGMHLLADVANGRLASSLALGDVVLARSDGATILAVPSLVVAADAATLDLADRPLRDLHAALELPVLDVADARRLDSLVPPGMPVAPGAGTLHGKVHAETWRADGRVTIATLLDGDLGVHVATEDVRGTLHLEATVDANTANPEAATLREAAFAMRNVVLAHAGRPAVTVKHLTGDAHGVTIADPLAHAAFTVEINQAALRDGAALDGLLPHGTTWGLASDHGRFDATIAFGFDHHVGRGRVDARVERMGVSTGRGTVWGDAKVALAVDRWFMDAGTIALAPSSVEVANVHGRLTQSTADDLTARRIVLSGRASSLSLKDPGVEQVDARFVIDEVAIADAKSLDRLLPRDGAVHIDSGSARANGALVLASDADHASGNVTVEVDRGAVTVGKTQLTGNFTVEATLHGLDRKTKAIDLAGSRLVMKNVAITNGKTKQWDGLLVAKSAALRFPTGGPDLEALVWLEADDARPLLGVVLDSGLPKLLAGLVSMPRLRGRATLHFGPHVLHVSEVEATGGDVALRGAFGIYDGTNRGAFVVEKGPVSVGLRIDDEGAHPRLFGLDGWLTNELRSDADRAAKKGEPKK